MRRLKTVLAAVLIAGAAAACDLLQFFPGPEDESGASPGAESPTVPDAEFTVPPDDQESSAQNLPSPTIEIPPPVY